VAPNTFRDVSAIFITPESLRRYGIYLSDALIRCGLKRDVDVVIKEQVIQISQTSLTSSKDVYLKVTISFVSPAAFNARDKLIKHFHERMLRTGLEALVEVDNEIIHIKNIFSIREMEKLNKYLK
jgi:hypothetical protein